MGLTCRIDLLCSETDKISYPWSPTLVGKFIGASTQGHSRAMPYQTESEEKLLLSEKLTLS